MNRALLIILIPVLFVVIGYVFVLRYMGLTPGYWRLAFAILLFFAALWWVSRKSGQDQRMNRR